MGVACQVSVEERTEAPPLVTVEELDEVMEDVLTPGTQLTVCLNVTSVVSVGLVSVGPPGSGDQLPLYDGRDGSPRSSGTVTGVRRKEK